MTARSCRFESDLGHHLGNILKKVFIIHGFEGAPNGGWRPWLMGELEKKSIYACALSMPTPNSPIPSEWTEEISRHVEQNKRDQIYLVGHSLGVPAILKYLENTSAKNVKGLVLVSGPVFKTTKKKVDKFLNKPFDFEQIRSKVGKIEVIHGTNDRSVPFDQAEFLARNLDAKLTSIENGGHLNGSSGWFTLPQCLDALLEMME